MFDRIVLFLGAGASAASLTCQGIGLAGSHAAQIVAIICSGVGAGCLAIAPSVRGGAAGKTPTP